MLASATLLLALVADVRLSAEERPSLLFLFFAPAPDRVIEPDWLAGGRSTFGARFELALGPDVGLGADALARCPAMGRFDCWVRSATATEAGQAVRFIALVAVRREEGRTRAMALLVDRSRSEVEETSELELEPGEDGILRYLEGLEAALARGLPPTGDAAIEIARATGEIRLDGRVLGRGDGGRVQIERVTAGAHRLEVGAESVSLHVTDRVEVDLDHDPIGTGLWVSGGALMAAGAALMVTAAVVGADGSDRYCVHRPRVDPSCGGRAVGFGYASPRPISIGAGVGGPGFLPIGVGLVTAGAGATLGSQLDEARWWIVLAGAAAGLATSAAWLALD